MKSMEYLAYDLDIPLGYYLLIVVFCLFITFVFAGVMRRVVES